LKSKNSKPRLVTLDDGTVLTLRQFADRIGVSYQTLYNYMIVRGMTLEQTLARYQTSRDGKPARRAVRKLSKITFDGVTASLSQHCKRLGLNYNTVFVRVKRGCTPEQALRAGQHMLTHVEYMGREWTYAELAEYANLPVTTFQARLNNGWSIAEACGDAPRGTMVEYEGRWYSIPMLSRMTNTNRATLYSRLFRYGWTVDETINGYRTESKNARGETSK